MLGRTTFRCACSAFAALPRGSNSSPRPSYLQTTSTSSHTTDTSTESSPPLSVDSVVKRDFGGISYWDTSNLNEFRVCFILGGPGAGKGTQSDFIKNYYPSIHLSAGELLRNVPANSPHKELVEDCLVAGKIVPVEISLSLLRNAMEQAKSSSTFYLIDGFPRNFDNLDGWTTCMTGVASVWGVLMYKCPLQELERRIMARAETSGRSDDNIKTAQKRFATFEKETVPVVDALRMIQHQQQAAGRFALQVVDIQGDQSIDAVWRDTQIVMNGFVANDVLTANALLLKGAAEGDVQLYSQLYDIPDGMIPSAVMQAQESNTVVQVSNAKMEHVTGTKVVVSYDRDDGLRETRVWSHQGVKGWINIHFARTPLEKLIN